MTQVTTAAPASKPPVILTPFVAIALLATLTAGTVLGAVNLARIQLLFASVSPELKRLHAAYQIFGLMGAFICGVALQAVPRFWQAAPPTRRFANTLVVLLASTLGLRALAFAAWMSSPGPLATGLLVGADLAGLAAAGAFAGWIARAWRGNRRPATGIGATLVLGAALWPAGALLWLLGEVPWGGGVLLTWGVYAGEELLLWGFILSWFLGMAPHVTPYFPRLALPEARTPWVIAGLVACGALSRAAGALTPGQNVLEHAGLAAIATACLLFVTGSIRPARALRIIDGPVDRSARVSIGWLGIAALVLGFAAARAIAGFGATHQLVVDAARHSAVVGFFLGMLMVVSSRIVPVFSGQPLRHPKALAAGLVLLHLGVATRWAQAGAALVWPGLLPISGLSGFLVAAGTLPWIANLLHCLKLAPCQALARRGAAPGGCAGCAV